MMEDKEFDEISKKVKILLSNRPNHPHALELYALFKQATVGDVNIERPSLFNFKGKAKWDSWNEKKGLSQEEAKLNYLILSKQLLNDINAKSEDLYFKAELIKDVMPQVPLNVIRIDLEITNSIYETVTRLLDGTVFFVSENSTIEENNSKIEDKNEIVEENQELKENEINCNENISSKNTIKSQSPMSYSTKASVFEKDPIQRMKSYQERKQKLIENARNHYIEKHGLDK